MANRKDIELVLQTKFEAGNTEAGASEFAKKFSETILKEFATLGDQIGQKILEGIQRKFAGMGGSGAPDGLLTQFAGTGTAAPLSPGVASAVSYAGTMSPTAHNSVDGTPAGQQPTFNTSGVNTDTENQARRVFRAGASTPSRVNGFASLITSTLASPNLSGSGLSADEARIYNTPAMDMARGADGVYGKFQLYKTARKFDPNASMDAFGISQKDLGEAGQLMTRTAQGAGPEITKLIDSITKLTQATDANRKKLEDLEKVPANQRTASQNADLAFYRSQNDRLSEMQIQKADLENTTGIAFKQGQELTAAAKGPAWHEQLNPKTMMGVAAGLGLAGTVFDFASNRGLSVARGEAGTAAMEGFGTRDILNKNYSGSLATAFAGGEGYLRGQASSDQTLSTVGDAFQSAGSAVGSYFTGGPTNPLGFALGANAARSGLNFWTGITERDSAIASRMKAYQGESALKNQEYLQMYAAARGNAQGAYRGATAMGSDTYAGFLSGTERGVAMMSMAPVSLGGIDISGARGNGLFTPANGPTPEVGGANKIMPAIRAYANAGFDRATMGADLAAYQEGAGAYRGRNIMSDGMNGDNDRLSLVNEGAELRRAGFASVAKVRSQFMRGNDTYRDTGDFEKDFQARSGIVTKGMRQADDIYKSIRGAGFEEGFANRASEMIGAVAGSGIGAAAYAQESGTLGLGMAQSVGAMSGNQAGMILNQTQSYLQSTQTGAGLAGAARLTALDELQDSLGQIKGKDGKAIKLSFDDQLRMQFKNFSDEDLKRIVKEQGGDPSQVKGLSDKFNRSAITNLRDLARNTLGTTVLEDMNNNSDSSFAGQKRGSDAMNNASVSQLNGDAVKNALNKGRDVTGYKEAKQEAGDDATAVLTGMKTLAGAMQILEEASKKAAENLEKISQKDIVGEVREKELAKARADYASQTATNGAEGAPDPYFQKAIDGEFNKRVSEINSRWMTPSQAPGNTPGKK